MVALLLALPISSVSAELAPGLSDLKIAPLPGFPSPELANWAALGSRPVMLALISPSLPRPEGWNSVHYHVVPGT